MDVVEIGVQNGWWCVQSVRPHTKFPLHVCANHCASYPVTDMQISNSFFLLEKK